MPLAGWLWIALGGALGAVLRQAVALGAARAGLPAFACTLSVNALGCLAMGWLVAWAERTGSLSDPARGFWMVGALGAFTTYSTFAADTLELVRGGHPWLAALDVLAHVLVGLAALVAGRALVA